MWPARSRQSSHRPPLCEACVDGHGMQAVEFDSVPAGHTTQLERSSERYPRLRSHCLQTDEPYGAYSPAAQVAHALLSAADPGGHRTQVELSCEGTSGEMHGVQAVEPAAAASPGAQRRQVEPTSSCPPRESHNIEVKAVMRRSWTHMDSAACRGLRTHCSLYLNSNDSGRPQRSSLLEPMRQAPSARNGRRKDSLS